MEIDEIIRQSKNYLKKEDVPECDVVEILQRMNIDGSLGYQITLNEKVNIDVGYIMKINIEGFEDGYFEIPEWDYSVDSYLFDDLENGYEIIYMPLDYHYAVWCCIEELLGEIEHMTGMQTYLKYCKDHHISYEVLSQLGRYACDVPDVIELYQEINERCPIIDEFTAGGRSIVLACKPTTKEYVTWRTTPTRRRGYDNGHYFRNFHQAYEDFKERSHGILDDYFNDRQLEIRPDKKEKYGYER